MQESSGLLLASASEPIWPGCESGPACLLGIFGSMLLDPRVNGAKGQYGFKTGQIQQKQKVLLVEQIYGNVSELVALTW